MASSRRQAVATGRGGQGPKSSILDPKWLQGRSKFQDDDDAMMRIKIPLKPQDPELKSDPDDIGKLQKSLASEYTTKYLESIGVAPSKAALELVRKNLPIERTTLIPTRKSHGGVEDAITITKPDIHYEMKLPLFLPKPKELVVLGMMNRAGADEPQTSSSSQQTSRVLPPEDEELSDEAQEQESGAAGSSGPPSGHGGAPGGRDKASSTKEERQPRTFQAMASKFTFPFTVHEERRRLKAPDMVQYQPPRPNNGPQGNSAQGSTSPVSNNATQRISLPVETATLAHADASTPVGTGGDGRGYHGGEGAATNRDSTLRGGAATNRSDDSRTPDPTLRRVMVSKALQYLGGAASQGGREAAHEPQLTSRARAAMRDKRGSYPGVGTTTDKAFGGGLGGGSTRPPPGNTGASNSNGLYNDQGALRSPPAYGRPVDDLSSTYRSQGGGDSGGEGAAYRGGPSGEAPGRDFQALAGVGGRRGVSTAELTARGKDGLYATSTRSTSAPPLDRGGPTVRTIPSSRDGATARKDLSTTTRVGTASGVSPPQRTPRKGAGEDGASLIASRGGRDKGAWGAHWREHISEEVAEEIQQPFVVTDELVLMLLSDYEMSLLQWREGVSDEVLAGRVSEADFERTMDELSCESSVALIRTMLVYLYDAHMRQLPPSDPEQEQRCLQIHALWARMRQKHQHKRPSLFFTLPVILLGLRVAVEAAFTRAFPAWASCEAGVYELGVMNEVVTAMLDPHNYHSEISLLQSSSRAIQIMRRYASKTHPSNKQHAYSTSPLIRSAIVTPHSREVRALMYHAGHHAVSPAPGANGRGANDDHDGPNDSRHNPAHHGSPTMSNQGLDTIPRALAQTGGGRTGTGTVGGPGRAQGGAHRGDGAQEQAHAHEHRLHLYETALSGTVHRRGADSHARKHLVQPR
eukprot:jgi/Mesvir1/11586/Mv00002-RA.1